MAVDISAADLAALRQLDQLTSRWALARWTPWDGPSDTHTVSQATALRGFAPGVTAYFGGNRSGKTELLRVIATAFALGGDHPAVRLWRRRTRFPDLIPPGPGRVWLVALTDNDSRRYHRQQILRLLDQSVTHTWNLAGRGEARIEVDVPRYDRRAEIIFKSAGQGRDAMQGDECRLIGFDEEPPEECWIEAGFRVGAEPLRLVLTMTPLKGLTWVYDKFVAPPVLPDGTATFWLDALRNPHLGDDARAVLMSRLADLPPQMREARRRGAFSQLSGLVYPAWNRAIHVVKPFKIPRDWPRYRAIDFGLRNPTACLWGALSPDDQLVLYREHYRSGWALGRHAERIRALEAGERIDGAWADPTSMQQIVTLRREHGIHVRPAHRDVSAGLACVADRLARPALDTRPCPSCNGHPNQVDACVDCEGTGEQVTEWGPPGLVVFDTLRNFIREIEAYSLVGAERGNDRPVKRDDHLMDCLRYLCTGLARGTVCAA